MKELFNAIKEGNLEEVKQLLANGADVNSKDNKGFTPLHWAVLNEHIELVQLLIDNGADVNSKDNKGYTPLYWAIRIG